MPIYVAKRALGLVDISISKPKVLILGVAYKPGVGDVRETPVSELRAYLIAEGAEVAWHDPFVPIWEGSKPVDLDWECDVAILATKQPGMDVGKLISKGTRLLDCTNSIIQAAGVVSL
jgi:UDP-N-acetyl-D-glucosamine dehydrogenase